MLSGLSPESCQVWSGLGRPAHLGGLIPALVQPWLVEATGSSHSYTSWGSLCREELNSRQEHPDRVEPWHWERSLNIDGTNSCLELFFFLSMA